LPSAINSSIMPFCLTIMPFIDTQTRFKR
jgi:hypothetical protein